VGSIPTVSMTFGSGELNSDSLAFLKGREGARTPVARLRMDGGGRCWGGYLTTA